MRSKVPSCDRQGQAGLLPLFRQSCQHAGAQITAGESIDKVKIFHEEKILLSGPVLCLINVRQKNGVSSYINCKHKCDLKKKRWADDT